MAKPNPRVEELEKDISEIKLSINDTDIPQETRDELSESLSAMEEELLLLKTPKPKAPKEKKPAKPEYMFGDKTVKASSVSDMESEWNKRMETVKSLGGKVKTKSIFSRAEAV